MGNLDPDSRLAWIPEIKWLRATIIERALTKGDYILSGGIRSDYYIDKFRLFSDPTVVRRIARMFSPIVAELGPELIAGTELGGVILATAVSQMTNLPMIVVRKQAKSYGAFANDFVEGPYSVGQRVLLLEDVVTSGREVLRAKARLEELGLSVTVYAVVSRGLAPINALVHFSLPARRRRLGKLKPSGRCAEVEREVIVGDEGVTAKRGSRLRQQLHRVGLGIVMRQDEPARPRHASKLAGVACAHVSVPARAGFVRQQRRLADEDVAAVGERGDARIEGRIAGIGNARSADVTADRVRRHEVRRGGESNPHGSDLERGAPGRTSARRTTVEEVDRRFLAEHVRHPPQQRIAAGRQIERHAARVRARSVPQSVAHGDHVEEVIGVHVADDDRAHVLGSDVTAQVRERASPEIERDRGVAGAHEVATAGAAGSRRRRTRPEHGDARPGRARDRGRHAMAASTSSACPGTLTFGQTRIRVP